MTQEQYDRYKELLRNRRLSGKLDGIKYVRLAEKLGEWGKRGGIVKL